MSRILVIKAAKLSCADGIDLAWWSTWRKRGQNRWRVCPCVTDLCVLQGIQLQLITNHHVMSVSIGINN